MKKVKTPKEQAFTKVIWKLCLKPINCPASKQLTPKYEVSWEFKCPNSELHKLQSEHGMVENQTTTMTTPDKEETLTNFVIDTNFVIKSKTIHCNYEDLKSKLGYEPDAMEFDIYLKILLKQFQSQILSEINMPIMAAS